MNLAGLSDWLRTNVVGIVLLVIAIGVLVKAQSKDYKASMVTFAIVLLGLAMLGLATGGRAEGVGSWLAGLLFG